MKLLGAKLRCIFAKFFEALLPSFAKATEVLLAFILAADCEVFGRRRIIEKVP
jgi:hypothetical protein